MTETLLIIGIALLIANIVLTLVLLKRSGDNALGRLQTGFETLEKGQEKVEKAIREEFSRNREEAGKVAKQQRDELSASIKAFSEQLSKLTASNEQRMDKMRATVEQRLKTLQEDNAKKLEQMRLTVDEKLQKTLETRLGESFKLVSDRLEKVHKGLGEMQALASGVGDLKRVLTNVKTRGTWGEIQLGNLLEQVLTPEQFESNVQVKKGSNERVEYAIKLPGQGDAADEVVWLPIDAKFPQEDYQRLLDAQENSDSVAAETAAKQLENRIKSSARDIRDKYINPPSTTDFAIMFLPTEGLYAEVLRRPGLASGLQLDCRVTIAGPMTLAAILNSLQMGFKTLAIQKRSSEVWKVLGAVKAEFGKFGGILDKVHKQLGTARTTIETATRKTKTIERKLGKVQELPTEESTDLLMLPGDSEETPEEKD